MMTTPSQYIKYNQHTTIMTVEEFYQEMEEQTLEDIFLGYIDMSYYDDELYTLEIDYTTQSWHNDSGNK